MPANKFLDRNVPLQIGKMLSFGTDSASLWYDGVAPYQWHSFFKWNHERGQLSPLLYNVYTDDLNHHLQATHVGCLGKFTELFGWYGVICPHGNCSSETLGGMSRIYWTSWHCIQHNENSMYAGPAKHRVGSYREFISRKSWGAKILHSIIWDDILQRW